MMQFTAGELLVRTATLGEMGLAHYHVEKEGLAIGGSAKSIAAFSVLLSGQLIGFLQLYAGHAPIGVVGISAIAFAAANRNKHCMSNALALLMENIKFHRLEATPAADNISAIKGLIRLGFKKEGVLHGWYPRSDHYVDAVMYAKTED